MSCVYPAYVLFVVLKWRTAYGGRCLSAGALVRSYGTTNEAPTQNDNPSSSRRVDPIYKWTQIRKYFPLGPETENDSADEV
jgi:hypothetical protein